MRYLRVKLFMLVLGTLALCAGAASAQEFPNRTIRMVVAFPAGGPTDFVARIVADKMKTILGRPVIIENKPGANGAVGADFVARADPDGYTLYFTTVGAVAVTPHLGTKVNYDPIKDFAPITLVVQNTTLLVVRSDLDVSSAKELAALAKQKPGSVVLASTGVGSMPHLALELFQASAGIKLLHVPYRGAAPALTDLLGGQVQGMFGDVPVLLPQIQAGKIKAIGAVADKRNEALPDVPTLAEQGFPNTDASNWYGLLAPAKTPAPVITKLHDTVVQALNDPGVHAKLVKSGAIPSPSTPEEFGKYLKSEFDRWGQVVKEKGIKG